MFRERSPSRFFILLFGLSIPLWVIGSKYDIQIFPGFKLFQLPLAMPFAAALILTSLENGRRGIAGLLKRTYDVRAIKPKIWLLPIMMIYPGISLLAYLILRLSGAPIPAPHFSWILLLGYSTVFLMTYGEELGMTGYALDPMQKRHTALLSGLLLGIVWAGYHIPGFVISGYYSIWWIFWHALYTIAARVLFVWMYNNSGKSLFSMALLHWTFGLFSILWPTDNLQKASSAYNPQISAVITILLVLAVTFLWGPKTLAKYRYLDRTEA